MNRICSLDPDDPVNPVKIFLLCALRVSVVQSIGFRKRHAPL